ncbi:MAG TPA: DEAD/DEAH box helicase [Herpetosiphonaceae bacterium]
MSIIYLRCKPHNRDQRLRFQLLQIVLDNAGRRAQRALTEAHQELVKGAWEHTPKPIAPGIYCQHCLNAGQRTPLDIDEQDLQDLGLADPPLVFQTPSHFDAASTIQHLQEQFGDRIQTIRELPSREAVYADEAALEQLHPDLRSALRERFLPPDGRLYAFQAAAVAAAQAGHDVVVTTPTASGKSLTYTIPVLDALLKQPNATALYISPLLALTEDQLGSVSRLEATPTDWNAKGERFSIHRVCRTLNTGAARLTIARYDGSVSPGDRQAIREKRPQYVLTTPDMLHMGILGGALEERRWRYLIKGLRYVVIDELHTYRGIMGASFANLLRRLQRLCRMLGAQPQFLCASATMIDPDETVKRLIGRHPVVIDGDQQGGAPLKKRHMAIWSGSGASQATSTQAKDALLYLLGQRVRTIAFARSISEINDIYRFVKAELRELGLTETIINPYMRELLPDAKRQIIADLKQGRLQAVISTTALSMGIDIGSLSAAIIIGFPGSIAQLWQQAGRAGRQGEGLIIFIADSNPLDQFFVRHPDVLFDLAAEPVYCNPDNPYVVRGHLLRAVEEAPLTVAELAEFGPAAAAKIQELCQDGLIARTSDGTFIITPDGENQAGQPFRNLSFSVTVMTEDRQPLVEVDAARAQRALHKHAHYQYIDRYYRVTRCDLQLAAGRGEIFVQEIEYPDYTTTASVERAIQILQAQNTIAGQHIEATYGLIHCEARVNGYYQVPLFVRNEPFRFQPLGLAAPPPIDYQTQSCWIQFPASIIGHHPEPEQQAGLYSLAGAIKMATAIEALCDTGDIEALGLLRHPDLDKPGIIVYDAAPGGVGISEVAFKALDRVLARAEQLLVECPYCSVHPESRGCPYCVTAQYGDEETINRQIAIDICRAIRS